MNGNMKWSAPVFNAIDVKFTGNGSLDYTTEAQVLWNHRDSGEMDWDNDYTFQHVKPS